MSTRTETSLSHLSDHDWNVLRNMWARGSDWFLCKAGRKWQVQLTGSFPLFKTRDEAEQAVSDLIRAEARRRRP